MLRKSKLFIIDGNSLCYRAYYAIRNLSTSAGKPTNAVYGFVNMLRKIIEDEHPDYLAVAFDTKGPTFRHKLFNEYKIQRRPMPEDLIEQMPVIKRIIDEYNITVFQKEGYEADDILATVVAELKNPDLDIFIVTSDKDALQLVGENVSVYNPYHKEINIYDSQAVRNRFGIEPQLVPDILALSGDSSDNIPGVKGIGEKTAKELIQQFGSLDSLIKRIEEVKQESLREALKENRQQLEVNRRLTVLDKTVPIEVRLEELKIKGARNDNLIAIFKELEFKNLLKELLRKESANLPGKFNDVDTKKKLNALIEEIEKKKIFSFQAHTEKDKEGTDKLAFLSISYDDEIPSIIQIRKGSCGIVPQELSRLFENKSCVKACYDLKKVKSILYGENICIGSGAFDVMLAAYLIDPSLSAYTLEDIALRYLGIYPQSALNGSVESNLKAIEEAEIILKLYHMLNKDLKEKKLLKLYTEVELPLVDVLFSMEKKGVHLDINFLNNMSSQLNDKIEYLEKEITGLVGRDFNLDSPKQLREILFGELRLPVIKKGKTGPSTDEEVLNRLSAAHMLPKLILEYRELAKLKSTYVDNLIGLTDAGIDRIHTTFDQTGTETGRLSSKNPNLQNIPVKTEFARQIRRAISSPENNYLLLSADYSQIELRILAHLSCDEALIKAFKNHSDIHKHTASLIFSVPEGSVDEQQRSIAKTVNFGIIYGMSPFGLSKELNITANKAEEFIDSYFKRYPKVKSYIDSKINEARQIGFVTTILNRRRFIPEINSPNQNTRQFAERTAINTPIQGSAADIIKLAMIKIHEKICSLNIDARIILQIHDELLFEFNRAIESQLVKIVSNEMENVIKLQVPLEVSLKIGQNWLDMSSYQN